MDDSLATLVGKIILAWGRLDQQLHLILMGFWHAASEPMIAEGRFNERRKILRRQCILFAGNDKAYTSKFDKVCAQLVRLERKRGLIAHGHAGRLRESALFLHFPEAFSGDPHPENQLIESTFTFDALGQLEKDIDACSAAIMSLALEAFRLWRQESQTARPQ